MTGESDHVTMGVTMWLEDWSLDFGSDHMTGGVITWRTCDIAKSLGKCLRVYLLESDSNHVTDDWKQRGKDEWVTDMNKANPI